MNSFSDDESAGIRNRKDSFVLRLKRQAALKFNTSCGSLKRTNSKKGSTNNNGVHLSRPEQKPPLQRHTVDSNVVVKQSSSIKEIQKFADVADTLSSRSRNDISSDDSNNIRYSDQRIVEDKEAIRSPLVRTRSLTDKTNRKHESDNESINQSLVSTGSLRVINSFAKSVTDNSICRRCRAEFSRANSPADDVTTQGSSVYYCDQPENNEFIRHKKDQSLDNETGRMEKEMSTDSRFHSNHNEYQKHPSTPHMGSGSLKYLSNGCETRLQQYAGRQTMASASNKNKLLNDFNNIRTSRQNNINFVKEVSGTTFNDTPSNVSIKFNGVADTQTSNAVKSNDKQINTGKTNFSNGSTANQPRHLLYQPHISHKNENSFELYDNVKSRRSGNAFTKLSSKATNIVLSKPEMTYGPNPTENSEMQANQLILKSKRDDISTKTKPQYERLSGGISSMSKITRVRNSNSDAQTDEIERTPSFQIDKGNYYSKDSNMNSMNNHVTIKEYYSSLPSNGNTSPSIKPTAKILNRTNSTGERKKNRVQFDPKGVTYLEADERKAPHEIASDVRPANYSSLRRPKHDTNLSRYSEGREVSSGEYDSITTNNASSIIRQTSNELDGSHEDPLEERNSMESNPSVQARLIISYPMVSQARIVDNPHKRNICSPLAHSQLNTSTNSFPFSPHIPRSGSLFPNSNRSHPGSLVSNSNQNHFESFLPNNRTNSAHRRNLEAERLDDIKRSDFIFHATKSPEMRADHKQPLRSRSEIFCTPQTSFVSSSHHQRPRFLSDNDYSDDDGLRLRSDGNPWSRMTLNTRTGSSYIKPSPIKATDPRSGLDKSRGIERKYRCNNKTWYDGISGYETDYN